MKRAAGGRDWLEKTLWRLRDREGGWIGANVVAADGSHDLGPLQINSWWIPKIAAMLRQPEQDVDAWLQSNTCFNVEVARWIFLSALRMTGDYGGVKKVEHNVPFCTVQRSGDRLIPVVKNSYRTFPRS